MKKITKNPTGIIVENNFIDFSTAELLSPVNTQNYFIIQVADSYYSTRFNGSNHKQHCDIEITYTAYNKCECVTDGITSVCKKNYAYLSFYGETHAVKNRNFCRFLTVAFNVKKDSPIYPVFLKIRKEYSDISKRLIFSPELEQFISRIVSDFNTETEGEIAIFTDCFITAMLLTILKREKPLNSATSFHKDELPSMITEYIDENYKSILSLIEVCEAFSLSYSYIGKKFKEQYGMTMQSYLISKKMEYAKIQLEKGKSVTELSEELNYTGLYNFSRAFKNYFGYPPKQAKTKK